MVVGPVFRTYALMSALVGHVVNKQTADAFIALLPGIDWHDYPWSVPLLPASVLSGGAAIDVTPLKSPEASLHDFEYDFHDYSTYAQLMSHIVTNDPYNRSFDFAAGYEPGHLERPAGLASDSLPRGWSPCRAVPGHGAIAFQRRSDLGQVSSTALTQRTVCELADASEGFPPGSSKDGHLDLGMIVRLASGRLSLPSQLVVDRGGVIIAPDSIVSNGIRNDSEMPLVLCSTSGDLEVNLRVQSA